MQSGEVKFFNASKGWGFIRSHDEDYFCHFRNIVAEGYKSLDAGDKVEFVPKAGAKHPEATEVRLIQRMDESHNF